MSYTPLAVAKAAGCPVFFFAADDEETDFGCNAVSGSLVSFGCRLDRLSVQFTDGRMTIAPLNYLEDEDEEGLRELISAVKTLPEISLLKPRDIEGGQVFYENPVGHWPKNAGNPTEIVGFGTWDPLLNLDSDFAVAFEKLNP